MTNAPATTRIRAGSALSRAAAVRSGAAFLTVLTGEGAGVIVSLRRRHINVGRGDNADLRLKGDTISRNHARLTMDPDGYLKLVDIGSRNGTFVNGVTVHSEVLRDGDRIAFGGDAVMDLRYGQIGGQDAANVGGDAVEEGAGLASLHLDRPPRPTFEHTLTSYRRALETREERLGSVHPAVAVALDCLGSLCRCVGDHAEAIRHHERALAIYGSASYVTESERALTRVRLARAYIVAGRFSEAEELLEAARTQFERGAPQPGERLDLFVALAFLAMKAGSSGADSMIERSKAEVSALRPGSCFHMAKHDYLSSELDRLAVHLRPSQAFL